MRREGVCNSPCWLQYNWLVRENAPMDTCREQEITKHCDPQSSVDFGHSSLTVLPKLRGLMMGQKVPESLGNESRYTAAPPDFPGTLFLCAPGRSLVWL